MDHIELTERQITAIENANTDFYLDDLHEKYELLLETILLANTKDESFYSYYAGMLIDIKRLYRMMMSDKKDQQTKDAINEKKFELNKSQLSCINSLRGKYDWTEFQYDIDYLLSVFLWAAGKQCLSIDQIPGVQHMLMNFSLLFQILVLEPDVMEKSKHKKSQSK